MRCCIVVLFLLVLRLRRQRQQLRHSTAPKPARAATGAPEAAAEAQCYTEGQGTLVYVMLWHCRAATALRERTQIRCAEQQTCTSMWCGWPLYGATAHTSATIVGSAAATSRYSWHSFRISLACRLRPHCDDSTIQTLCRWATPTSMKLYARLGRSQYSSLLDRAETVDLDAVQAATLWRSCPHIDDDHHYEFAADLATHLAGEGGTRSQPPGRDENITA